LNELVEGASVAAKVVSLDTEVLQHGDEEIAEGFVLHGVEGEVLAMFEAAAGEENGQVGAVVDVRIAEVAAVEDHRLIQQACAIGGRCGGESGEEIAQVTHLLEVHFFEFGELFLRLAVVAEIVVTIAGALLLVYFKNRRREAVHHERDDAGGVGLKGQAGHVEHELDLGEELGLVGDVLRLCGLGLRLGFLLPFAGDGESLLQFSHGGQILIETAFVVAAEVTLKAADVIAHGVEDAATILKAFER
jgi:hypothetical protein